MSAGGRHLLALRADGSIRAIGENSDGQCDAPMLAAGVVYTAVAASQQASGALTSDGGAVGWGGIRGIRYTRYMPMLSGHSYVDIAAGSVYVLALRSDGTVFRWHIDSTPSALPQPPANTRYIGVGSSGVGDPVALRSDGMLVDPLGNSLAMPPLPSGLGYRDVSVGRRHYLALRSDGSIVAWGENSSGQCNVPPLPAGMAYVQASAGDGHSVALRNDGSVVAWGDNTQGQCNVPAPPAGLHYVEVSAGREHCIARVSDGRLVTWGTGFSNAPALPPGTGYVDAALTLGYAVALRSDGVAVSWGGGPEPPPLPAGLAYVDVDLLIALRSDGTVVTWGGMPAAPALPPGLSYVAAASAFTPNVWRHSVALRSDGMVVAWGDNRFGQCNVPALPPGLRYVEVAAGAYRDGAHTVALRSDGNVVAWGDNAYGQCNVRVLPPGMTYTKITAATAVSGAIRSDGAVVRWGSVGNPNLVMAPPGKAFVEVATGGERLHDHTTAMLARSSDGTALNLGSALIPPLPSGRRFGRVFAGLGSGESQVNRTRTGMLLQSGSFETFAPGCSGSQQAAQLRCRHLPRQGQSLLVEVNRLPQSMAFLAVGFDNLSSPVGALPLDLGTRGMPGCKWNVRVYASLLMLGVSGAVTFSTAIPNRPDVVDRVFHVQALIPDPAANAAGAVVSAAATGVVGS
jgi:alpha-tubulin suppressor-like RCC1 family protein